MKPPRAILAAALSSAGVIILTAFWRPAPLLIWNASASVPIGLYAVRPAGQLTVGEFVVARPPEPLAAFLSVGRFLPEGLPIIKPIAALVGQSVCRRDAAVSIDGTVVANARQRDHAGRPLPVWRGCHRLAAGEVFLLNAHQPASLDGRYFGALPTNSIIGRAAPIWTQRERAP